MHSAGKGGLVDRSVTSYEAWKGGVRVVARGLAWPGFFFFFFFPFSFFLFFFFFFSWLAALQWLLVEIRT